MKNLLQVLTIFIFIINPTFSQNTKLIDSLKHELALKKEDDSVKVMLLTKLHEKLMFSKPEEAKKYAELELKISKKINYENGKGLGFLHIGNYYNNRSENDSAKFYYEKAKTIFTKTNKSRGIIFVNHSLSDIERIKGNYDEAININKENIKLIENTEKNEKAKDKFIGAQYTALSNIYIEKGSYNIALSESLKALNLFDKINDLTRKADVLKQIGDIEFALKNYKSAIEHSKEALKIYEDFDDKVYMAYAANLLGNSYRELNDLKNATQFLNKAISLGYETNGKLVLTNTLHDLAVLYITKKEYNKAKTYLLQAKEVAEEEDIKLGMINAYEGLAKVDYNLKKPLEALTKIDKGINIAKTIEALPHLQDLYKYRSKILEHLNRGKEALFYIKAYQKINDSLFSIKKSQQIEELKTIYEIEKKETEIALQKQEIKSLNQEVEIGNLKKGLYAGGMTSFIVLSGLLYFGFKQRIKKNKIEREKQEAIYKQEIEFKKKELASQTLHLVQKNTFIQELKENLVKIKQSPELFKVEFRRLVMLLKKESAEDKDWEIFKSYFTEVHNNFDNKLKAIYSEITEKEIRLSSFLRMNLSTKEIASMLNVLPESVLKSKYRLKKKLKLDKETDLTAFLNSL